MTTTPEYRKRQYLSYSTLMSFIRCPRKYFYEKCGIYPTEESVALLYGTAMHAAIARATLEGLEPAFEAFKSVWDESCADNKRSLSRARQQLAHFCHTHAEGRSIYEMQLPPPLDPSIKLTGDVSPYEIPFVMDIGIEVPLVGRLDGWCRYTMNGDYYAYEFKTMSRLTGSTFDGLELNPQLLTLALLCRTLTGKDIKGVMFEAMLVDPKKVENMTHPVPIQDWQLPEALTWLQYWCTLLLACEARAARFVEECKASKEDSAFVGSKAFPKNFAGCSAYSLFYMPGSACEYMNLCRVSDWRGMLPYYQVKPEHRMIELTNDTKAVKV